MLRELVNAALRAVYEPDGRTLKISAADAPLVRTIYDLYGKHRNIWVVKTEADKRGLKTVIRTLSSGRLKKETAFSFSNSPRDELPPAKQCKTITASMQMSEGSSRSLLLAVENSNYLGCKASSI